MKVLLDENLPHDLRHLLLGHDVFTTAYQRWAGVKNGALLANAASAGFDVFLTIDAGIEYEQNLIVLPIAVIKIQCSSNKLVDLMPLVPKILEVLGTITPKQLISVGLA